MPFIGLNEGDLDMTLSPLEIAPNKKNKQKVKVRRNVKSTTEQAVKINVGSQLMTNEGVRNYL